MFQVYILKSLKDNKKTYVGLTTKGVINRLKEHNLNESKYTKTFSPWRLIYYENFTCMQCAENRERFLKNGVGFRLRKLIAENFKIVSSAMQNGE